MTLRDVSVKIGDRPILNSVNATFQAGLISAVVGPSGSGKSTLLSVVAGIRRPDSGTILYDFGDGKTEVPRVAWVPQGSNVLARRSVRDNVAVGAMSSGCSLGEALDRAQQLLVEVGLGDRGSALARDLSGGELQRVGFARALATDAKIVLADEPSASLDKDNTRRVAELLASLTVDVAVVIATHDPMLVDSADMVLDLRGDPHAT